MDDASDAASRSEWRVVIGKRSPRGWCVRRTTQLLALRGNALFVAPSDSSAPVSICDASAIRITTRGRSQRKLLFRSDARCDDLDIEFLAVFSSSHDAGLCRSAMEQSVGTTTCDVDAGSDISHQFDGMPSFADPNVQVKTTPTLIARILATRTVDLVCLSIRPSCSRSRCCSTRILRGSSPKAVTSMRRCRASFQRLRRAHAAPAAQTAAGSRRARLRTVPPDLLGLPRPSRRPDHCRTARPAAPMCAS